ncbi:MAG: succinate-semialdehyde dehydrogenase/glutarate-semialdehyde dehydrogenase, partial [Ilumatobacter sp.]
MQTQLFIGGQWRTSSTDSTFDVFDPATGELIVAVASASADDAEAACGAA